MLNPHLMPDGSRRFLVSATLASDVMPMTPGQVDAYKFELYDRKTGKTIEGGYFHLNTAAAAAIAYDEIRRILIREAHGGASRRRKPAHAV